eukprot:2457978-Rhodomonas_salina.4
MMPCPALTLTLLPGQHGLPKYQTHRQGYLDYHFRRRLGSASAYARATRCPVLKVRIGWDPRRVVCDAWY